MALMSKIISEHFNASLCDRSLVLFINEQKYARKFPAFMNGHFAHNRWEFVRFLPANEFLTYIDL